MSHVIYVIQSTSASLSDDGTGVGYLDHLYDIIIAKKEQKSGTLIITPTCISQW